MRNTRFHHDRREAVPDRARSYSLYHGRFIELPSHLTAVGSSSLLTTADDLVSWIRTLDDPVAELAPAISRMHKEGMLTDGRAVEYAYGLSLGTHRGAQTVGHGGSWAGYRAKLVRFPDHGLAVAVLGNDDSMNPRSLTLRIAEVYLEDRLDPLEDRGNMSGGLVALEGVGWSPQGDNLQAYEGEYHSAELDATYRIVARGDRLVARHVRAGGHVLRAVSLDEFRGSLFGRVRFVRDGNGAVNGFTSTSDRVRNLRFDRVR